MPRVLAALTGTVDKDPNIYFFVNHNITLPLGVHAVLLSFIVPLWVCPHFLGSFYSFRSGTVSLTALCLRVRHIGGMNAESTVIKGI